MKRMKFGMNINYGFYATLLGVDRMHYSFQLSFQHAASLHSIITMYPGWKSATNSSKIVLQRFFFFF